MCRTLLETKEEAPEENVKGWKEVQEFFGQTETAFINGKRGLDTEIYVEARQSLWTKLTMTGSRDLTLSQPEASAPLLRCRV